MNDMNNYVKRIGAGTILLAIAFSVAEGQKSKSYYAHKKDESNYCFTNQAKRHFKNPPVVKAGVTYGIVNTNNLHNQGPGIEFLLEEELNGRLFAEFQIGGGAFYNYHAINGALSYSEGQSSLGLTYKPVIRNGWTLGLKGALGASSEFYKTPDTAPIEESYMTKFVELNAEKIFRNGKGLGVAVSKEVDRNIWRMGARFIFNSEIKNPRHYSNKKNASW